MSVASLNDKGPVALVVLRDTRDISALAVCGGYTILSKMRRSLRRRELWHHRSEVWPTCIPQACSIFLLDEDTFRNEDNVSRGERAICTRSWSPGHIFA
jgi:hypothetical protein